MVVVLEIMVKRTEKFIDIMISKGTRKKRTSGK